MIDQLFSYEDSFIESVSVTKFFRCRMKKDFPNFTLTGDVWERIDVDLRTMEVIFYNSGKVYSIKKLVVTLE